MTAKPTVNWLLAFVPIAVALDALGIGSAPLVFFAAALAIVPAAALIVRSTSQIAARTGPSVGGLLNATFGNAPELIIAFVALQAGLLDMVRASIVGAILANLLLSVGAGMLLGGIRHHEQEFNASAARLYGSMMLLAVICLLVPSAFARYFVAEEHVASVHSLNVVLAVFLLVLYVLYLVFMLRTHAHLFAGASHHDDGEGPAWSTPRAVGSLVGGSALAAWMSEILVGAAEGTGEALGMSEAFIGLVLVAVVGGVAESLSAISAARRNEMDLTMGIAYGSSVQIALFVAPLLVLASQVIAPAPLYLSFGRAEIGLLFIAVLIGVTVASEGRSNWFRGAQLLAVYFVFALLLYYVPTHE